MAVADFQFRLYRSGGDSLPCPNVVLQRQFAFNGDLLSWQPAGIWSLNSRNPAFPRAKPLVPILGDDSIEPFRDRHRGLRFAEHGDPS